MAVESEEGSPSAASNALAAVEAPVAATSVAGKGVHSLRTSKTGQALHRIREVRQIQGVTLRTVARHTRKEVRVLRQEENPTTDLHLSDLLAWQKVLDVPLAELLVDDDAPLSRPVQERAQMLRIMKTAASIHERANSPALKRLTTNLLEQLQELMPELKDVAPWHSVGQRRSADELGRAADPRMTTFGIPLSDGE